MTGMDEIMRAARKLNKVPEQRDKELLRLLTEERGPAVVAFLLEFREDLEVSVSQYDRSPEERAMDAGGLATVRKMLDTLEGIATPPPPDPEAPKPAAEAK